ncbi:MAG: PIG-L deacetylase family protein [Flavobacteriales bacterium]
MRFLYIFPHPDDESFGPAAAMHHQLAQGHEVHLLTLTRGEATKVRFELGLDQNAMGDLRYKEMQQVESTLGLSSMEVLRFPDSGLKELDPRRLETAIKEHVQQIAPQVLVSYPVHGISGFHDHLVTHAVVKRAFMDMKEGEAPFPERLAFYTIRDQGLDPFQGAAFPVRQSIEAEIDCAMALDDEDMKAFQDCLDCYESYQERIEASGVKEKIGKEALFELFGERPEGKMKDLTVGLSG